MHELHFFTLLSGKVGGKNTYFQNDLILLGTPEAREIRGSTEPTSEGSAPHPGAKPVPCGRF